MSASLSACGGERTSATDDPANSDPSHHDPDGGDRADGGTDVGDSSDASVGSCDGIPCPEWVPVALPHPETFVKRFFVSSRGRVFVTHNWPLSTYYSDDLGGSWTEMAGTPEGNALYVHTEGPDGELIASDDSVVHHSTDHGLTWSEIEWPSHADIAPILTMHGLYTLTNDTLSVFDAASHAWKPVLPARVVHAARDGTLLVDATLRYRPQEGWVDISGRPGASEISEPELAGFSGSGVALIAANGKLLASDTLGTSWFEVYSEGLAIDGFADNGTSLAIMDERAVYVFYDGSFRRLGAPFDDFDPADRGDSVLGMLPDGRILARNQATVMVTRAAPLSTPLRSLYAPACNDGQKNGDEVRIDCGGSCVPCSDWTVLLNTPTADSFVRAASGTLFALGQGVWRSVDRGASWTRVGESVFDSTIGGRWIEDGAGRLFLGFYDKLYASEDDGRSFALVEATGIVPAFTSVAATGTGALVGNGPDDDRPVVVSSDGGKSWRVSGGQLPINLPWQSLTLFSWATGSLFAAHAGSDGFARSSDGGEHWTPLMELWDDLYPMTLRHAGHGVLTSRDNQRVSLDAGETWIKPRFQEVKGQSLFVPAPGLHVWAGRTEAAANALCIADQSFDTCRRVGARGLPAGQVTPWLVFDDGAMYATKPPLGYLSQDVRSW